MEVAEHIEALDEQGQLMSAAASRGRLDQAVPNCPDWTLRDLLRHQRDVHRWARSYVSNARTQMMTDDEEEAFFSSDQPSDLDLVDSFRQGHALLCHALRSAPADLECWSFLPAPSPLAFWTRRQTHETTIHRVDTESVPGTFTPIGPVLAADGVDELLGGFAARSKKLLRDPAPTMGVVTDDTDDAWLVTLGPDRVVTERIASDRATEADCIVRGAASDLYLTLWNRPSVAALKTERDASVLKGFCESLKIRWS